MKRPTVFLIVFIIAFVPMLYFAFRFFSTNPSTPAGLLAADKGYGVTIDLTSYGDDALSKTLTELHRNSLTWIRQPIHWAEIEATPGQFDWRQTDRIFTAIAHENELVNLQEDRSQPFKLIAVLDTTPLWARPSHSPATAPPVQLSDFGNFVRAFTARYGDIIDHYQIWHEPNLSANWGNAFVEPSAYANLLREAALNIWATDPDALILTAALAPTLENGPLNLDEIDYLDQLYQAKANRWFDIVAGQAYGFDSEPSDLARTDTLNFSRLELVHQVMLKYGDGDTPIWATAFGWNALPANWSGAKSPWKSDTPSAQAQRTALATTRARRDWPWLGPMLAVRWDATNLAADDPAQGFALRETPQILAAIQNAATDSPIATPGTYSANHLSGHYSSGWRFALSKADIPRSTPGTLTIAFAGTRLDLTINRGPYRGYLRVTIDGQPANMLPQDSQGLSYIVLYDPLRESETVTVARQLPPGSHKAVIEAEGGWGQWPIDGWTVYNERDTRYIKIGLVVAGLLVVLSGLGLVWLSTEPAIKIVGRIFKWGQIVTRRYTSFSEIIQIIIIFALAIGFYMAPDKLKLPLLVPLALTIILRPDLGLALIAFSLSFLSIPTPPPIINLSPIELILIFIATGFILKKSAAFAHSPPSIIHHLHSTDWAALFLLTLALLATLFAANFGVSMFEWRTVVLASVAFYFLIRLSLDFGTESKVDPHADQRQTWPWRLIDAFVAGATLQATLALYAYFFAGQYITTEGVRRAVGIFYESPNHLALFLGRVWPILLVVTILPGALTIRRRLYGLSLVVVGMALFLTFSRGALLLGLPVSIGTMAFLYALYSPSRYRRWAIVAAIGGITLVILALIPLNQTARFSTILDFSQSSTGFFRLELWQASLNMLRDHWFLGVGLDNFLYQYRTVYILPNAWQEPNLSHPHNLVLDFGTRLGVGGIAVLVWLQIAFWRNAWQVYKNQPEPLILGLMGNMVVFLSHGLVDNSYFLVDLAFAFFLVVGVVQGVKNQKL